MTGSDHASGAAHGRSSLHCIERIEHGRAYTRELVDVLVPVDELRAPARVRHESRPLGLDLALYRFMRQQTEVRTRHQHG